MASIAREPWVTRAERREEGRLRGITQGYEGPRYGEVGGPEADLSLVTVCKKTCLCASICLGVHRREQLSAEAFQLLRCTR